MAVPLVGYLSNNGGYWGFDIVRSGIEWCQKNVTSKYPNFQFLHSDIQNKYYNPSGKYQASTYKFPYETGFFDFIFLTSVFTHMFPADLENYLKEISRVLKTHGTCFITFFLLNNESEELIRKDASSQKFIYDLIGCFTTNKANPEAAIAYKESDIRGLFKKYQLSISEPVQYGSWCGRERYLSYQDIVLAIKN
jgi:SAM-dependent methyltransferase